MKLWRHELHALTGQLNLRTDEGHLQLTRDQLAISDLPPLHHCLIPRLLYTNTWRCSEDRHGPTILTDWTTFSECSNVNQSSFKKRLYVVRRHLCSFTPYSASIKSVAAANEPRFMAPSASAINQDGRRRGQKVCFGGQDKEEEVSPSII